MAGEEQFLSAIELIADKLGIAASEIFSIFVGAQMVIGVLAILECVIVVLLGITTYFIAMKLLSGFYTYKAYIKDCKESDKYINSDDKNFILMLPLSVGFLSVLVWIIFVDTIKNGVIKIMCPEYSSIIEIVELVI